jgi:hypothetical protein
MGSKIRLSDFEMGLLKNSEWILTKNVIIIKAQQLLGEVSENIIAHAKRSAGAFPEEIIAVPAKILKGENYQGLPWLMLDYPRYFDKENIFAIRTMFWWGNFFSTTLHLSGKYKAKYGDVLASHHAELGNAGYYYCIHEDQWHHHFEKDNYVPAKQFSDAEFAEGISQNSFIKLSKQVSFNEWNNAADLLTENFREITNCLV